MSDDIYDDVDLDDLLQSALDDFDLQEQQQNEAISEVDQGTNEDAKLSTTPTPAATTSPSPPSDIAETLKALADKVDNLENQFGNEPSEQQLENLMKDVLNSDAFKNILEGFGEEMGDSSSNTQAQNDFTSSGPTDSTDQLASAMEGMINQLFAKDILYEPLSAMQEQYVEWFTDYDKNKEQEDKDGKAEVSEEAGEDNEKEKKGSTTASEEEYGRYKKQHAIIIEMCTLYENSDTSNNNLNEQIMDKLNQLQELGHPPAGVLAGIGGGEGEGVEGDDLLSSFLPTSLLPNLSASGTSANPAENCAVM